MYLITHCKIEWLPEYSGYAINPFIGCGYGCYKGHCWSYLQARRSGRVPSWEEWQRPRLNSKFQGVSLKVTVAREAGKLPKGAVILLSATCDPFQPDFFGYNSIVENILHGLSWVHDGPQLWVLTKSAEGLVRFKDYLIDCKAKVGVTLTSLEWSEWEPFAAAPSLRMLALEEIKKAGLETYVSIEPWMPEVTNPRAIIERSRGFVDFFILGSFNYAGVDSGYYKAQLPTLLEWLEKESIPFFVKKELKAKAGLV